MAKARILCMDDDRPTVTIMSGVLKKEGYEVEIALDGSDGLEKARAMKPDLVILNTMMSGLDGYQVCRQLKQDPDTASIGVIMLAAQGGVDEEIDETWRLAERIREQLRGFDVGALEFLTKPFKAKELVERVKAVLWALDSAD
jgi:DNA-binding response OmpR family regulator